MSSNFISLFKAYKNTENINPKFLKTKNDKNHDIIKMCNICS